ncbi:MAG: hypothetical protein WCT08_00075 [Patescibacteria group bacterium]|jgi:uncharacterized repeat protein (TIGR01451 family)
MPKSKLADNEKFKRIPVRKQKVKVEDEEIREEEVKEENSEIQGIEPEEKPRELYEDADESKPSAISNKKVKILREEVLDAIYKPENSEEKPRDMKKIEKGSNKHRKLYISLGILFVLAVASASGFFVFSRKNNQFNERITLLPSAPTSVAAGDELTITIAIKNNEKIAIKNSELTFTPPDGFTFKSSTPAPSNEFNNAWEIGTLNNSSGSTVTIVGRLVGNQEEEKSFNFTLGYRPANFNYDFQKNSSLKVRISSSVLKITPEIPLRIFAGMPTDIPVTIENTGTDKLDGVKLIVDYPESFSFSKSDPKPSEKENTWQIASIPAKSKVKIIITGSVSGSPGDTPEFKFRAGKEGNKEFEVQAQANGIGTIVKAGMGLIASITNPSKGLNADWGETLNYMFSYKNDSESDMQDAVITVEFMQKNSASQDVAILDLDNRSGVSAGKLDGRTVTWTKSDILGLAMVKAGEGGDILLRVPLKSGPEIKIQEDKNFVVTTNSRVSVSGIADIEGKSFETQAPSLQTKINTKLNVEPEARYYNEEQIPVGSGPIPPQVGKTTVYQLSWTLTNPTNEATQIVIISALPDGVTWVGKQSVTAGQAITYNAETREVTWRINRVPPGTGSLFASLEAKFEVSITPSATDLGKIMILLNQTVTTARDEFTLQDLRIEKAILTTDLNNDVAGQGKGLVAEAAPGS